MLNKLELSELMSAKFCHDLAGPIGAISNGVEFLNEDNPTMKEKAHSLVESSAKQAVCRLQFFRQAYGVSPKLGEANLVELKIVIDNYLATSKIKLNWPDSNVTNPTLNIGPKFGKILLNFVIIIQNILIHGGEIKFTLSQDNVNKKAIIEAVGTNWKLDSEIENILMGNFENIQVSSKNIQVYYTNQIITDLGASLKIEKNQSQVNLTLEYNKII